MKYEDISVEENVIYINKELSKGRKMQDIEINDYHVNKGVIQKRIQRKGYKRVGDEFILMKKENNTDITTNKLQQEEIRETTKDNTKIIQSKSSNTEDKRAFKNDEIEKLNKLLKLDVNILEKMIQEYTTKETTKSSVDIKDNNTIVTSIRVNKELYSKVRQRVKEKDIKLQEAFFNMMIDYLNKN